MGPGWGYGCDVARVAKQLVAQFDEDTAYERFVLDTIATAGEPPNPTPPPRDDLRGGGLSMARSTSDWLAADSVAQAVGSFRPLGFGAAYKVIDMLVELVMRVNREPCPRGRWTFAEKQTYMTTRQPARLPIPLQVPRVTGPGSQCCVTASSNHATRWSTGGRQFSPTVP